MGRAGCDLRGRLAEIGPGGAIGTTRARIMGAGGIGRSCAAPAFLAATSETAVAASLLAAGLSGVLLSLVSGWTEVERLAVRLAVAEAEAGLPHGHIRIAAMAASPQAVLALTGTPPPLPRLLALGLDGEAVTSGRGGPVLATARGIVLLAAAISGVAGFERLASEHDAMSSHADGFALALLS